MGLNESTFVMGYGFSDSPGGPINIGLDYKPDSFFINQAYATNLVKKDNEKYIYYKIINFEFKKTMKIKFTYVSLRIGDIIDFITRKTGIKKLIVYLTNGNCGCEARRVKFNKWFKIPFLLIKFENYTQEDVDIIVNNKNKEVHNQMIKKMVNSKNSLEEREKIKDEIFRKNLNKLPGVTGPAKPKSGCGCGAKKMLTKNTNVV